MRTLAHLLPQFLGSASSRAPKQCADVVHLKTYADNAVRVRDVNPLFASFPLLWRVFPCAIGGCEWSKVLLIDIQWFDVDSGCHMDSETPFEFQYAIVLIVIYLIWLWADC